MGELTSLCDFQPPRFSFYDAAKPMYTSRRNLPPSKIDNSKVSKSMSATSSLSFHIDKLMLQASSTVNLPTICELNKMQRHNNTDITKELTGTE